MRILTAATTMAIALSACSGRATHSLPPFGTIRAAGEAYANCVYGSARKLAPQSGEVEVIARQAVDSCGAARAEALRLRSVPVFFPTIVEFDEVHLELARTTIEKARATN